MRLAYLLNMYPMISTTFIRREIEAIEAHGQPILRFAVRKWHVPLIDPDDLKEQELTEYLLTGNIKTLFLSTLVGVVTRFSKLSTILPIWWRGYRKSRSGIVRHVGYLLQAFHFYRRSVQLSIDHVHTHFSTNSATVVMLARALGGPGYSFTVHGPDELVEPDRNSLREKVKNARFVVAITQFCKHEILKEAENAAKIRIIACGIDLREFDATFEPDGIQRLVCVGRLCPNKGQVFIPAAVRMVLSESPEILVDLIGDGGDRDLIEAEIQRCGVSANVRLMGWHSGPEVRREITESIALLLPSFAEGLPIVLMEAMALGRPVLTTPVAGIPELVDDGCGVVFTPGSSDAIATALRSILRSSLEERRKKGLEGRRRVGARHDINRSAETLIDEFKKAAGSK